MGDPKVIYHGATTVEENSNRENPPPYSAPHSQPSYPAPQPGYPGVTSGFPGYPGYPGYPGSTTIYPGGATVVTGQPQATIIGMPSAVIITQEFGSQPQPYTCKSCGQSIVTRVDYKPILKTHLCALLLCMFGMWPCICIPYCTKDCLSADHYCPNCNAYLGHEWRA